MNSYNSTINFRTTQKLCKQQQDCFSNLRKTRVINSKQCNGCIQYRKQVIELKKQLKEKQNQLFISQERLRGFTKNNQNTSLLHTNKSEKTLFIKKTNKRQVILMRNEEQKEKLRQCFENIKKYVISYQRQIKILKQALKNNRFQLPKISQSKQNLQKTISNQNKKIKFYECMIDNLYKEQQNRIKQSRQLKYQIKKQLRNPQFKNTTDMKQKLFARRHNSEYILQVIDNCELQKLNQQNLQNIKNQKVDNQKANNKNLDQIQGIYNKFMLVMESSMSNLVQKFNTIENKLNYFKQKLRQFKAKNILIKQNLSQRYNQQIQRLMKQVDSLHLVINQFQTKQSTQIKQYQQLKSNLLEEIIEKEMLIHQLTNSHAGLYNNDSLSMSSSSSYILFDNESKVPKFNLMNLQHQNTLLCQQIYQKDLRILQLQKLEMAKLHSAPQCIVQQNNDQL